MFSSRQESSLQEPFSDQLFNRTNLFNSILHSNTMYVTIVSNDFDQFHTCEEREWEKERFVSVLLQYLSRELKDIRTRAVGISALVSFFSGFEKPKTNKTYDLNIFFYQKYQPFSDISPFKIISFQSKRGVSWSKLTWDIFVHHVEVILNFDDFVTQEVILPSFIGEEIIQKCELV